jgi:hypothetical protein
MVKASTRLGVSLGRWLEGDGNLDHGYQVRGIRDVTAAPIVNV